MTEYILKSLGTCWGRKLLRSTLGGFPGYKEFECSCLFCQSCNNVNVNDANTRQGVSLPFEKNFFFEPTKSLEKCGQLVLGHLGVKILMRENMGKVRAKMGQT